MAEEASSDGKWLPIESNPAVMDEYMHRLGLPLEYTFHDVVATEDWALDMVPQPIFALLMVFPVTEASEAHRLEEAAALAAAPSPHAFTGYFMTQTIPNACGTIGLVHAVANTSALLGGRVPLADACWLHTFLSRALALTPDERCAALEADTAAEAEHAAVVSEGQSAVVDDTHQHFAVFVERGGVLWELDGRKGGPVPHGPTAAATLLRDAVAVVKGFMARDPDELRFTLIAMCEAPPQED